MLGVLTGPDAVVLAAICTGIPATIAAIASVRAARQAGAANRAVNDVGPDEPKLRDLVSDTNTVVIGLQADVADIQHSRLAEAALREARQVEHDSEHRQTRETLSQIVERLDRYAPVIDEWRRTHPEMRPDDGGQT